MENPDHEKQFRYLNNEGLESFSKYNGICRHLETINSCYFAKQVIVDSHSDYRVRDIGWRRKSLRLSQFMFMRGR